MVIRGTVWESWMKVQSYSYKINKYWGRNIQYDYYSSIFESCLVNPKSSHHKVKSIFFSYLYEMINVNLLW